MLHEEGRGGHPRASAHERLTWDGRWMALWPLSMAIGVWGTGMVYHGLARGTPTLWPGLALCLGGMLLSGRWIAQARRLKSSAQRRRQIHESRESNSECPSG